MLGMIERPAGFSLLAARKRWAANGKNKTLLEVLWMLGEHEKHAKPFKARVDWILERMIGGGNGCVGEEVKRLRDWIDGSDLGRGGFTSGSGAARQPELNKDEERKKAAKKRQEAFMQQMKAQQASFASIFGDGVDDDPDGDTTGGDGDECMSDTSGDKEEDAFVCDMYCLSGGFKRGRRQTF